MLILKDISKLSYDLSQWAKNLPREVIKANDETAKIIQDDIQSLAPGTGDYSKSITADDTKYSIYEGGSKVSTVIGSDMIVQSKKGTEYYLGELLENGTEHHAIPNAFNWGVIYGFDSDMYKRTEDENWHPGFDAIPHYSIGLEKNKDLYLNNLKKAIQEAKKN